MTGYYPDMTESSLFESVRAQGAARILAAILAEWEAPFTDLLQRYSERPVEVQVLSSGERPLLRDEPYRLDAGGLGTCRWRSSLLLVDGWVAASAELIWLPPRLRFDTCRRLDEGQEPAGAILRGLGMRRADRRAFAVPSLMEEVTGVQLAVQSTAVLTVGGVAVGIADENITMSFAEMLTGDCHA